MIKRILVGIDTSEHSRTAQAYAFHLARRLGATLIGVHVVDIVSIGAPFCMIYQASLGLEPYLDFSSKMREILNARGKAVLEDFAQAAQRENLTAETVLDLGVVPNQLCEHAKAADLLMIGHRGVTSASQPACSARRPRAWPANRRVRCWSRPFDFARSPARCWPMMAAIAPPVRCVRRPNSPPRWKFRWS